MTTTKAAARATALDAITAAPAARSGIDIEAARAANTRLQTTWSQADANLVMDAIDAGVTAAEIHPLPAACTPGDDAPLGAAFEALLDSPALAEVLALPEGLVVDVDTLIPGAGTVWTASGTALCGQPGALSRITFGLDHRMAQGLHEALGAEDVVRCSLAPWQVLSTVQEPCQDCSGTGAVPAGGGDEHVDNGHAPCTTCAPCAHCSAGEASAHNYDLLEV